MAPAEAARANLAEGAFTAAVLVEMAKAAGVDMPISIAVDAVLEGRLSVDAATEALLARPFKAES
jgi:glycerol-3-phosphate dehydrogenase (NAD(P)+)